MGISLSNALDIHSISHNMKIQNISHSALVTNDILHNGIVPCFVGWGKQSYVFHWINSLHEFTANVQNNLVKFEKWTVFFFLKNIFFGDRWFTDIYNE